MKPINKQKLPIIGLSLALLMGSAVRAEGPKPAPTEANELLLVDKAIAAYEKGNLLAARYEAALEGRESQRLHADWCRNDEAVRTAFNDATGWSLDERHAAVLQNLTDEEAVVRRIKFDELLDEQKKYFSRGSGIPCPFKEAAPAPKDDANAPASKTMGTLVWIVLLIAGILVYFLPSVVGDRKENRWAIFALNLLLGWTLVGWVVALVWACTKDAAPPVAAIPAALLPPKPTAFCPKCGNTFVGHGIHCANCGVKLVAPQPLAPMVAVTPISLDAPPPTAEFRDERDCPACAEKILKKARVCKHCGGAVEPLA